MKLHFSLFQFLDEVWIFDPDRAKVEFLFVVPSLLSRRRIGGRHDRRRGFGSWLDFPFDRVILYNTFRDLSMSQVVLKFTVGNGFIGELRNRALPEPKQQQHDRQVPNWRIPLWRLRFEIPFRARLML